MQFDTKAALSGATRLGASLRRGRHANLNVSISLTASRSQPAAETDWFTKLRNLVIFTVENPKGMLKKILLTLLTALLLALPWWGAGGWSLFFAFVPLLILGDQRPRHYWFWVALAFTLWNVSTTWWVGNATPVATFGIPVGSLFFTLVPFMIFHRFRFRAPQPIAWALFVTLWIAFEALFMNNEISFPWLTLGYGFADTPQIVQWYELTGSFGGSLWVLVANILAYRLWKQWRERKWLAALPLILWLVIPIGASLIRYATYTEPHQPVRVAVVQPNFDPYNEKFGGLTTTQQRDIMLDMADQAPRDVDYILTPETAFDGDFWLNDLTANPEIDTLRRFMDRFPQATLIAGATTFLRYDDGEAHHRWTRTDPLWRTSYDVYNSALGITAGQTDVQLYHKSKLVVGAELFPYPKVFGMLEFLNIDLGGVSGSLGMQEHRTLFTNPTGIRSGVAICYESVYGEFFTEYVRRGAQTMFVITNDGWWGDTPGYRQHFRYARLRAVETRRSIARCANTGISGLINQRGDVMDSVGWDQRALLTGEIQANGTLTPYVRSGDYIVRLSLLVLGLSILYYVAWRFRKRSLLLDEE